MTLTAELLDYSIHLHCICFIGFPRRHQRPGIQGLGDWDWGICMDGVLFIQERSTYIHCSNNALLHCDTFIHLAFNAWLKGSPIENWWSERLISTYKFWTKKILQPSLNSALPIGHWYWHEWVWLHSCQCEAEIMKPHEKPNEDASQPDTWDSASSSHA